MAKGGSPATTTQVNKTELSPEQKRIFDMMTPYAEQYASTPLQQYSGETMAGFTPLETQAQGMMVNQAATTGGALANQSAAAQSMLLDPSFMLDPANNQYVQNQAQAITGNVTDNLMQKILPGIAGGDIAAGGMYSGGNTQAGIAQGQAIGDTNQGLSRELAQLYGGLYSQGLGQMQGAVNNNSNVQAQQLFAPNVLDTVGSQQRAMNQAEMDNASSQFYTQQQLPFLQAQDLMRLISGMPGGQGTSTVTGATPKSSPLMSGLGGAATGASIGSMFGMPLVGGGIGALAGLFL